MANRFQTLVRGNQRVLRYCEFLYICTVVVLGTPNILYADGGTVMSSRVLSWLLLAVLALIWGSSFILIKRGLDVYTPGQVAALRMIIAGALMLPFAFTRVRHVKREYWLPIVVVGLCGNGIPAYLFSLAETQLASSTTGMLNALVPLFTLLVGVALFGAALTRGKLIGVLIGLGGAVVLAVYSGGDSGANSFLYGLCVIVATLMYGVSTNIIKYKLHSFRAIHLTSLALPLVGLPYLLYLCTTDFTHRLLSVPGAAESLGYIAVLASLGTSFGVLLFNKLIQISSPLFATSVTYIIPIVALGWGVFDGEPLGVFHLAGMVAILTGVYVVNKSSV